MSFLDWEWIKFKKNATRSYVEFLSNQSDEDEAEKNLCFLKMLEEDTVKNIFQYRMNIDTEFDSFKHQHKISRKMRVDEYMKWVGFYERRVSFCIPISKKKMFWIIHETQNTLWCS